MNSVTVFLNMLFFTTIYINDTKNKHLDVLQLWAVEIDPVLSQFPDYVDYLNGFQMQVLLRIFLDTLHISKTHLCP